MFLPQTLSTYTKKSFVHLLHYLNNEIPRPFLVQALQRILRNGPHGKRRGTEQLLASLAAVTLGRRVRAAGPLLTVLGVVLCGVAAVYCSNVRSTSGATGDETCVVLLAGPPPAKNRRILGESRRPSWLVDWFGRGRWVRPTRPRQIFTNLKRFVIFYTKS